MTTIWKFELGNLAIIKKEIEMPACANILSVGLDPHGAACLWAQVDTEAPREIRTFYKMGTGWDLNEMLDQLGPAEGNYHYDYLDTIIEGPYVWHVIEEVENE